MDKEVRKIEREEQTPLVSIFTLTYNHAPYIRQCLDGFLMQKTNFVFEVIINDDASTDGTTEIIREYEAKYPDIIKPIYHSENRYSKGERGFWNRYCLPKSRGKYIALCEGDDYWIDPLKLQKQVDFLEANPEYGMCYTNFNIWHESKQKMDYSLFQTKPDKFPAVYDSLKSWILTAGYVAPMTWVFRRELLLNKPNIDSIDGTFVLFAHFLSQTKVYCFMDDITAVYRNLKESVSHSMSLDCRYKRAKGIYLLRWKLLDIYHIKLSEEEVQQFEIKYRSQFLKLFVALDDIGEIEKTRKVLGDNSSCLNRVLLFTANSKVLRKMWHSLYVNYIRCV